MTFGGVHVRVDGARTNQVNGDVTVTHLTRQPTG